MRVPISAFMPRGNSLITPVTPEAPNMAGLAIRSSTDLMPEVCHTAHVPTDFSTLPIQVNFSVLYWAFLLPNKGANAVPALHVPIVEPSCGAELKM